jgi:nucleoside-diphosphate-sugar epimerase
MTVNEARRAAAEAIVQEDLARICEAIEPEWPRLAGGRMLITGGAGFLGYYLVQAIVFRNRQSTPEEQVELTVWDHFGRGRPAWIEGLEKQGAIRLAAYDVTTPLPDPMPDFTHVVHAASIASPIYYRQHPVETMDANVTGLRQLLDWARRRADRGDPLAGMLFFSTSEIYGDPDPANIPTPETYRGFVSCTGPRACYDESKRYGETLCVNFAAQYGVPVAVARPFNNYGPGLKLTDRRVIPDFARDVLAGRDIELLSAGTPTRTFCYITDAINGYYKILARGRPGEPYNIGVEAPEISMLDLAKKVAAVAADLFGYQGSVIRAVSNDPEYLTDNPNRRCPVISKARGELGYAPSVGIDDGLRRCLEWYAGTPAEEEV